MNIIREAYLCFKNYSILEVLVQVFRPFWNLTPIFIPSLVLILSLYLMKGVRANIKYYRILVLWISKLAKSSINSSSRLFLFRTRKDFHHIKDSLLRTFFMIGAASPPSDLLILGQDPGAVSRLGSSNIGEI